MISFDTIPMAPGGCGDPVPFVTKGVTMTNVDKTKLAEFRGMTRAGTAYGCHAYVGTYADCQHAAHRVKARRCRVGRDPDKWGEDDCGALLVEAPTEFLFVTPEVLAILDTWVVWTERRQIFDFDPKSDGPTVSGDMVKMPAVPEGRQEHEGLKRVGTFRQVRVHVGTGEACRRFSDGRSRIDGTRPDAWAGPDPGVEFMRAAPNVTDVALTPECLTAMLTWARVWDELPHNKHSSPGEGWCPCHLENRSPVGPDRPCRRCGLRLAGAPNPEREDECNKHFACRGCGDPMGPYEPDAEYPGDCAGCSSDRHKEWGDMVTDRSEKGGPIATFAEGRVSLHLDQLSDDKEKAGYQLDAGRALMHDLAHGKDRIRGAFRRGDKGRRIGPGQDLLHAFRKASDAAFQAWSLDEPLRKVDEAHEALCIAQDWDGAGVKPADGTEVDAQPVAVEGAAKPGWD